MDNAIEEGVRIHQDVLDALDDTERALSEPPKPLVIDGDLYDKFKAEGMDMPGVIRGLSRKEQEADLRRHMRAAERHAEFRAIHAPKRGKPVKKDNGLKQRLRELQRQAALGKAGE